MPIVNGFKRFENKLRNGGSVVRDMYSDIVLSIGCGDVVRVAELARYIVSERMPECQHVDAIEWDSDPLYTDYYSSAYEYVESEDDDYEEGYEEFRERVRSLFLYMAGGAQIFQDQEELLVHMDMEPWYKLYDSYFSADENPVQQPVQQPVHQPRVQRGSPTRSFNTFQLNIGEVLDRQSRRS